MFTEAFDQDQLQAEYVRLGHGHGWTFMMTPEGTLRDAQVAFVGLNPGGGGPNDTHEYGGSWDSPKGNAYFVEKWGPAGNETPIQQQVQAWHSLLGLGADDSFCAQFVPFRSPNWASLGRKEETLDFAMRLWTWVLTQSPAKLVITMGKPPAQHLSRLLGARQVARLQTGWDPQTIDVWEGASGYRIVAMPHPSRYTLFNRRGSGSDIAKASLRAAAGLPSP